MTLLMRDQENQEIGEERGRREGIREGMLYTLVSQVRKKLLRGYSKEQIADLLEEDIQTVENICRMISAHPEEDNRDGAIKIFLNAKGNLNDVSSELRAFLDYLGGKKSEDEYVQKLERAVKEAKRNRKWRHEYMTLLMRDQENQEIGEERGRREGRLEGMREGRLEGQLEGELRKLVSLIRKKQLRGYPKEQIADLLEEDIQTVEKISRMISAHPEEDDQGICQLLMENEKTDV